MSDDSLLAGILIKNSIKSLEETIKEIDKQNQKLQKSMFWLTLITTILTFVQILNLLK